jgi:hypothetical protein
MQKEVDDHSRSKNWELMHKSKVPDGAIVLPGVWSMKRKRRIDGSKQIYGKHSDETYSPVVTWPATSFFLVQALINKWYTKQIDFVLAYTQAPIERELYMAIPRGIELEGANKGDYVLKLLKNLYGQKQGGRVWNQHLVKGLKELGFAEHSG